MGLVQAELQMDSGQLEQCLASLARLKEASPNHPSILKMLVEVYQSLSDWEKLFSLLPDLRGSKVWSKEGIKELELIVCAGLLEQTASKQEGPLVVDALHEVWKRFSTDVTKASKIVGIYALKLAEAGANNEAEQVLRVAIKRQWDDKLVQQYGQVVGGDAKKRLSLAESWLKSRANNAELLLCAGRLALNNKLWGKAKEYFETSLHLEECTETFAELGRLYAHLGEHSKSNHYFQQGLLLSTHGLPDLPMPDEHTGLGKSKL